MAATVYPPRVSVNLLPTELVDYSADNIEEPHGEEEGQVEH